MQFAHRKHVRLLVYSTVVSFAFAPVRHVQFVMEKKGNTPFTNSLIFSWKIPSSRAKKLTHCQIGF